MIHLNECVLLIISALLSMTLTGGEIQQPRSWKTESPRIQPATADIEKPDLHRFHYTIGACSGGGALGFCAPEGPPRVT